MGKGAGNCFSAPTPAETAAPAPAAAAIAKQAPAAPLDAKMVNIAVITYSTWGHINQLAEKVVAGLESVEGVKATHFQIPETLPEEVLKAMHAPAKPDIPVITADKLKEFDGFVFGIPTRFGRAAAQVSAFFDTTGALWQAGALIGKPVALFDSCGTQNGGIETTALTTLPFFVHHGLIFVPQGYQDPANFDVNTVRAYSPYGAATYAGADGSRQPSELELTNAKNQGAYFAKVASKLAKA